MTHKTTAPLGLAVAAVLAGSAGPAVACRYNAPAEERVRRDYDAVVVATVTASTYGVWHRGAERPSWQATGRSERLVKGAAPSGDYAFGRSGASAACDDGQPAPRVGERWVLYLQAVEGRVHVTQSYPLTLAETIDPRFGAAVDRP